MAIGEEVRAARDAQLDAVHERLTNVVEQLVSGDGWQHTLEFVAKFRSRFNNALLISERHLGAFSSVSVVDASRPTRSTPLAARGL